MATTAPTSPEWGNAEAVEARYGITQGQLGSLRFRGEGPSYSKRGRMVRYRFADVERWLEAGLVSTTS